MWCCSSPDPRTHIEEYAIAAIREERANQRLLVIL